MNKNNKLESAWDIVYKYEKSLKGFDLFKYKARCIIDNIYVWIVVKYYKLKIKVKERSLHD